MAAAGQASGNSSGVLDELRNMIATDPQVKSELALQGVSADGAFAAAREVLGQRPGAAEATLATVRTAEHELAEAREPSSRWYVTVLYGLLGLGTIGLLVLLGIGVAKWTGHLLKLPIYPFVAVPCALSVVGSLGTQFDRRNTREVASLAVAVDNARSRFNEQLRSLVILPGIERATRVRFVAPSADPVLVTEAPALASRINADRRIETESYRLVLTGLNRPGGATIGLAGTRGSGKSELLRAFCENPSDPPSVAGGGTIGVVIPAPVAYEAESFLRVLVRRVAERVPGYDPKMVGRPRHASWAAAGGLAALACLISGMWLIVKVDHTVRLVAGVVLLVAAFALVLAVLMASPARRILTPLLLAYAPRLRDRDQEAEARELARGRRVAIGRAAIAMVERMLYTATRTSGSQASASWRGVGLQQSTGVSLGQLPLSEADLVKELDDFVQQLSDSGYTLRIGIDELDKLADDDAKDFLTGLKVLFTIRGCSFLLTLSQDASAQFARRGMAIRDVFDSSLDSVTIVRALTYPEARRLVQTRGTAAETDEISDTQVLLCFLLSGGLPRDLLRYCRELGELNLQLRGNQKLSAVMKQLLQSERDARVAAIEQGLRGRDEPAGPAFILELERIGQAAQDDRWAATLAEFLAFDVEFAQIANAPEHAVWRLRDKQAAAGEDWIRDARRQLMTYLFFLQTVHEVMTGLSDPGASGRVYKVSPENRFEVLADAQRRMEIDPAAGWRRILDARLMFELAVPAGSSALPDGLSPADGGPVKGERTASAGTGGEPAVAAVSAES
jgi:hypothetical protein